MERIAIVGTAGSWTMTPWHDPGLRILSLNDAYRMQGFKRADEWYDFHPIHHMYFAAPGVKQVYAHEMPVGAYVRPFEHLQWLAQQTIPVYLNPDWQTQTPVQESARPFWEQLKAKPNAHPFPKADVEAFFGTYFMSSPAWMIAKAIMEGAKEIHIYGIHLATEQEYREQRPQFEFLIGRVLGSGKLTVTHNQGLRTYETANGRVVLPEASPVLQSDFQYAFERRPFADLALLQFEAQKYEIKKTRAIEQLKTAKPWQRIGRIQEDLWRAEAYAQDIQDQISRRQIAAQIG